MSFSDLFDSEFKSRNKGHFSAIVRVALTDGKVSKEEQEFIDKLAYKLDIGKTEYEEIMENPMKYPINPPYLYTQRIDRLYDLARMVHADHHIGDKQEILLERFAVALGFTPTNAQYIVAKALSLVDQKVDSEVFAYEMMNMNK